MMELYESQRAMRNMRKAAMQRGVVAILDVGSSKIACLVLRFDGTERLAEVEGIGSMAGQSGFRVIGAATTRSRGVRFGEVSAMQEPSARSAQWFSRTEMAKIVWITSLRVFGCVTTVIRACGKY